MNDFTKEELEWLLSDHWSCGANYVGLYDKIQSLIDNYCEHEWDNFYKGSINTGIYCNKCLKKLKGS